MIRPAVPAALAACLLITALAPPALAADRPAVLEKAFKSTILSTYPDGRTARLWLQPSGAYAAMGRKGDRSDGTWKIKAGKLCLKQAHPFAPPLFRYCTPLPSGETWRTKAVTGEPIQVRLVSGRAQAPG